MSNYLNFLKLAKNKRPIPRNLIPVDTSGRTLISSRVRLMEKMTYLSEERLTAAIRDIFPDVMVSDTSLEYSSIKTFMRLSLSAWLTPERMSNHTAHAVKEAFFNVINNPRSCTLDDIYNEILPNVKNSPLLGGQIKPSEELRAFLEIPSIEELKQSQLNLGPQIANKINDSTSVKQWIKILYNMMKIEIKSIFEVYIAIFLLSFVKTGNVTEAVIEKRLDFYKRLEFQLIDISPEDFKYLYEDIIKERIDDGFMDPEQVIGYFADLLVDCTNMKVKPLVSQASYRNMTPLLVIAKSLSEFSDFPWEPMFKRSPVLMTEFIKYLKIIDAINGDSYMGYKTSGASSCLPHLASLCLQLQILGAGQETLIKYQGVGSERSVGKTMYATYTKWVSEYLRVKGTGEIDMAAIMKGDMRTSALLSYPLVSRLIRDSMMESSEEVEEQDDEEFNALKKIMEENNSMISDSDSNFKKPPKGGQGGASGSSSKGPGPDDDQQGGGQGGSAQKRSASSPHPGTSKFPKTLDTSYQDSQETESMIVDTHLSKQTTLTTAPGYAELTRELQELVSDQPASPSTLSPTQTQRKKKRVTVMEMIQSNDLGSLPDDKSVVAEFMAPLPQIIPVCKNLREFQSSGFYLRDFPNGYHFIPSSETKKYNFILVVALTHSGKYHLLKNPCVFDSTNGKFIGTPVPRGNFEMKDPDGVIALWASRPSKA